VRIIQHRSYQSNNSGRVTVTSTTGDLVMETQALKEIKEKTEALTVEENLELIAHIIGKIRLFSPQRREGRRDVFSYSLPLILQKFQRTGRKAKNKIALFLKII